MITQLDSSLILGIFMFLLLLTATSSWMMNKIAQNFYLNDNAHSRFTITDLELSKNKIVLQQKIGKMDAFVKQKVALHLKIDYVFMISCYIGVALICFIASSKTDNVTLKSVLMILGYLQIIAWAFDIIENLLLTKWLDNQDFSVNFGLFKTMVRAKFLLAVTGLAMGLLALLSQSIF
jgi:hypothetical protein